MTFLIPHINAVDPSRTLTLRNKWVQDFRRRFKLLSITITEAIVDQDVLGLDVENLNTERINIINATGLTPRQFDFQRDADKINAFTDWIEQQSELYVLSGGTQGLQITGGIDQLSSENNWMNTYIDSGYQQGIKRGRQELKKAGVDVGDIQSGLTNDPIQVAFNTPIHANRVGLIYTRAFSSLKAINASMDSIISDALAIGIAEGKGPRQIASAINKAITGKGEDFGILDSLGRFIPAQRRAEILARTEVMRAHHSANMGEYKAAGLMGIKVQAEWVTANDSRVCPICQPLDGKIFSIEEAETMIPVHPQCRCVAVPYIEDEEEKKATPKKTTKKVPKKTTTVPVKKKKLTEKQLETNWKKSQKELDDYLALPFNNRDLDKQLKLIKKERKSFYNYMGAVPDNKYNKYKNEIIDKFTNQKLTPAQKKNMRAGLNYVPIDILDKLQKDGVRISFSNKTTRYHRAYYSTRYKELVVAKNESFDVIGHEMSHAIDHMYGDYSNGLKTWKTLPNKLVTKKDGINFNKWYENTHSGTKGTYRNGDGNFWTDNWLDDYEGRIYNNNRDGTEWWAMNVQRYSDYRYKKETLYNKRVKDIEREINKYIKKLEANPDSDILNDILKRQKEKLKEFQSISLDKWAKTNSSWDKVNERYPDLAKFIENKFGDRISGTY